MLDTVLNTVDLQLLHFSWDTLQSRTIFYSHHTDEEKKHLAQQLA